MNVAGGSKVWFTPLAQLERMSLEFCAAYRTAFAWRLKVERATPKQLWMDPEGQDSDLASAGLIVVTRVPAYRPREGIWQLPARRLKHSADVFALVECFRIGCLSIAGLDRVVWPGRLKRLFLGERFNCSVDAVSFPTSLQELHFGEYFNQPIRVARWQNRCEK